jgi:large subunit ribosomal protein L6
MSRIGLKPIPIPDGVDVQLSGREVSAKGKHGALRMTVVPEVTVEREDGRIVVRPQSNTKRSRAVWGMQRTIVANMLEGVSRGYTVDLEISGVGYRAQVQDRILRLQLGFSHDVTYAVPDGIEITCDKPTTLRVFGADRQQVGQVAAEIRRWRPPEPYKGKGIRYASEHVRRKEGKKK